MAVRWKLEPKATGVEAVIAGPRGSFLLNSLGAIIMYTEAFVVAPGAPVKGWYWYGMGRDTYSNPLCATEKEARKEARAYYDSVTK